LPQLRSSFIEHSFQAPEIESYPCGQLCKVLKTKPTIKTPSFVKNLDMPDFETLPFNVSNIEQCTRYSQLEWVRALSLGRRHAISGRWYDLLVEANLLEAIPKRVRDHLWSDRLRAELRIRSALWETDRLLHALRDTSVRLIVLKGAAYLARRLAPGIARMTADVDILVPEMNLSEVEAALNLRGWQCHTESEYDDKYYRQWMHELPPFRHLSRATEVDVHHNLLPRTNRLCPDPSLLFDDAWRVEGSDLWTLCAPDILIHCALHGFYSGEFINCFRDVLDVHELVSDLAARDTDFWAKLISRTEKLRTERAVYYALRYARRHFGTNIPGDALKAIACWAPGMPVVAAMDRAIAAAFLPALPPSLWQKAAQQALYLRSHWIKMPPSLLTRHLWTKFRMRWDAPKVTSTAP
jgi:Uncharacterised nucleotidyltransferase